MIRLTNSEMRTWRRCKRKWWLGNYRELSPNGFEFNRPLSIGSRVHDVLAKYYAPGVDVVPMDYLRETIERDVAAHPEKETEIRKEGELCERMLEGYFEWLAQEGLDEDLEPISAESEMEVGLVDGVTVLSKIDTRMRKISDGKHGALETKTVQNFKDPLPTLQVDTQLLTEHLVEFLHALGDDPNSVEDNRAQFVLYNMLRKVKRTQSAKPPFYAREEVQHNVDELRSHFRHVQAIAREITWARQQLDAGQEHHEICYPNPTPTCSWECPFSEVCLPGLFDDGSDPEPLLADAYKRVDPLERYRSDEGLPLAAGESRGEVSSEE